MSWQIWIDTGGTFTDCIAVKEGVTSRLKILSNSTIRGKVLNTLNETSYRVQTAWHSERDIFGGYKLRKLGTERSTELLSVDIENSVIHVKESLLEEGDSFELTANEEVPVFAARIITETALNENLPELHMRLGSTRGTNALLERKGAKTVLVTNRGFKDVLVIGNQQRPNLFELNIKKPELLYDEVVEVAGRLDANGMEIRPIDESTALELFRDLRGENFKSVAISLMHGYRNETHEEALEKIARETGFNHISRSSKISPTIKHVDRTSTTLVNAYLDPIISEYVEGIAKHIRGELLIMSSAGGLMDSKKFYAKDSLLSGPAGGIVGASKMAEESGESRIITFDMGGTSTDVALYDGKYDYRYTSEVADAKIQSPSLAIETIAAGGGSLCSYDGYKFSVGPESMGASPGPACYGDGGLLTLTDINFLLGRLSPGRFSIPLDNKASRSAFEDLLAGEGNLANEDTLTSILQIANEKMAEAIRKISVKKGMNPADYTLLSFGGAGGQHACSVASILGIQKIMVPYEAGLLSAKGIGLAEQEKIGTRQILQKVSDVNIGHELIQLENSVLEELASTESYVRDRLGYFRFSGQEDSIEVDLTTHDIHSEYKKKYEAIYGHWLEGKELELESIKVVGAIRREKMEVSGKHHEEYIPDSSESQRCYLKGWEEIPVFSWEEVKPGAKIDGPALIVSENTSLIVEVGWSAYLNANNTFQLTFQGYNEVKDRAASSAASLELFTNRFYSVADEMGALLQRTSFSVNIRERLDFSCGVIDSHGDLIVNAPHIPVHLGSLGKCVRMVAEELEMNEGDVIITNHPYFGGSHLPDISLIAPVFYKNEKIGFVANRAHHAELGGKSPGSMPTDARYLHEEGVIINPTYLIRGGEPQWNKVKQLLTHAEYPTRSLEENLADIQGALASVVCGREKLVELCVKYGSDTVKNSMEQIKGYASKLIKNRLDSLDLDDVRADESLDDGSALHVNVYRKGDKVVFDFTGSASQHPGNLNATPSIVNSAVLYVLRVLLDKDFPLNEGLLRDIEYVLPEGLLNPKFGEAGAEPAVVGGNTEVSQRLTDTLLKAFGVAACSQGTMNNLLFGNDKFGYYETICGGVGAGKGFDGATAIHQHMTNTRITDPEIMELNYPVRLNRFEVRDNSGGSGTYQGGNGIRRELEFTEPLTFTLLTQHRVEAPYGMKGGSPGKTGKQSLIRKDGSNEKLQGICSGEVEKGDRLLIETPGGGGYGQE